MRNAATSPAEQGCPTCRRQCCLHASRELGLGIGAVTQLTADSSVALHFEVTAAAGLAISIQAQRASLSQAFLGRAMAAESNTARQQATRGSAEAESRLSGGDSMASICALKGTASTQAVSPSTFNTCAAILLLFLQAALRWRVPAWLAPHSQSAAAGC